MIYLLCTQQLLTLVVFYDCPLNQISLLALFYVIRNFNLFLSDNKILGPRLMRVLLSKENKQTAQYQGEINSHKRLCLL